jgi:foldase protein PrsA
MTRKFLWGVIVLLLLTNLLTISVWMNDRSDSDYLDVEVDDRKPVASIGKDSISYQEWMQKLESKYGKHVLQTMIDKKVVFQLAKKEGLAINEKVINREISLLLTMQGILSEGEIKKRKKQWAEDIKYRVYLDDLFTRDIEVTETQVAEYYERYSDQYDFQESIQLSHILVQDRETAQKIIRELNDGASFASLAREYSVDDNTRMDGGYLGYFTNSSELLPTEYYTEAIEMKEGTYSGPLLVANGVAVIYLHQLLPSVTFTFDEAKAEVKRDLALERLKSPPSADLLWDQYDIDWIYK